MKLARPLLASLLLAILLASVPSALPGAAGQAPQGQHEVQLSILEHHPYPDPAPPGDGSDPLGFPAVNTSDGGRDWMNAYYGATWFPTVRVDGVLEDANPRGGNVSDPYPRYEAMVRERLATGSPAVLRVDAHIAGDEVQVEVTVVPRASPASDRVVLRIALFEDPVAYEGGNGVAVHRFTVRDLLPGTAVPLREGQAVHVTRNASLDPAWDRDRLGVVAYLQNEDDRQALDAREVLQSATHMLAWGNATVQVSKAPLLEMYTAAWCTPCAPADRAVDRLAEAYGVPAAVEASPWRYLAPPTPLQAGLVVLAGLVLGLALVPRGGPGGEVGP